jgi:mRNA interferase HigB
LFRNGARPTSVDSTELDPAYVVYQNEIVRLIRHDLFNKALRKHQAARAWMETWPVVVGEADWQDILDVRLDYPPAGGVKLESDLVVTVFNVRGNEYRVLTHIDYANQIVLALDLLTHAEYDKEQWKGRY